MPSLFIEAISTAQWHFFHYPSLCRRLNAARASETAQLKIARQIRLHRLRFGTEAASGVNAGVILDAAREQHHFVTDQQPARSLSIKLQQSRAQL